MPSAILHTEGTIPGGHITLERQKFEGPNFRAGPVEVIRGVVSVRYDKGVNTQVRTSEDGQILDVMAQTVGVETSFIRVNL